MRTRLLTYLLLCSVTAAFADSTEPGVEFGGLVFGDLYGIPSHHLESGDGAVGLVMRRAYLTMNATLSDSVYGRARLEINQSGEFETYTFEPQLKDLYLGWRWGEHTWVAGLGSTITYDLIESIWGYRHLARTPMDLQGVPSRDTGLSIKGPVGSSERFSYRFMYGSGVDLGSDSSENEKFMGALTWRPDDRWTVDFYADYEYLDDDSTGWTAQAFAAYQTDGLRWGAQYTNQQRVDSDEIELVSAFLVKEIADDIDFVGRIDHLLQPSPRGDDIAYIPIDPSAKATLFFGGLDFEVNEHLALIPNFIVTAYGEDPEGNRPTTDIYLRLTLFLNFE